MKFLKTKVFQAILFSLTLIGVGVGTWFIASIFITQQKVNDVNPGNENTIELKKSKDVPVTLIEHETNGYFFFGPEGLALINERIKKDLQFGPEIEVLKSIRFNNLNVLSRNVNGQYSPSTLEMDISIDHFLNEFRNIPVEEKIELVFPTIFHEYGHHFSNMFITSIAKSDSRNSAKLYTKYSNNANVSANKNISSAFLNEFEKALHYDDSEASNLKNIDINDVSSLRSARDLYNLSNSINIKNNIAGEDYLGIDDKFVNKIPFRDADVGFEVNSDRYTYLFSIDELLTRKLQQITYIDNRNGNSIANNTTTFSGTEFRDGYSPSTMATDISRNKSIEYLGKDNYELSEKLLLMDYPYGGRFNKKDGSIITIDPTVETLWNAYYDIAGFDYGISQIYMNNSSILSSNSTRTPMSSKDFDLIKFNGFLSNSPSKNYKGLLLFSTEGSYKEHKFLENNYKYSLMGAKSGILNKSRDLNKQQNKFGYSTDYIDITKVDFNQPIKVWDDKNNNNRYDPLEYESLTVSPNRPTSTFRESFVTWFDNGNAIKAPDTQVNNIFEIINNSNEAFIQRYAINLPLMNPLPSYRAIDSSDSGGIQVIDNVIVFNNRNDRKKR
ncbi:MAG: MYPU_1760 family metalloprotease [Metamycoplasmataceae bacterium]